MRAYARRSSVPERACPTRPWRRAACTSPDALGIDQFIRARLVARTDPARSLALLERMTTVSDLLYVARQLERGRLAEKLNDRERAVDAYAYVAAAWQNTEVPQLRNAVQESRAARR